MSMSVVVAEAGRSDAVLLADIQAQASRAALAHIFPPADYPFPLEAVQERWRTFRGRILLATIHGRSVGFVGMVPPWLEGLYLVPEAWGSGVASKLHDRAVEVIRAAGCAEAHLWVLEHNARARRFYERRGWREDGTSRVVPYPPHPLDVGYSLTLAEPEAGGQLTGVRN